MQEDAALWHWLEQHDGRYYNLDKVASIVGTGFLVQSEGNMPQVHSTLREAVDAAMTDAARAAQKDKMKIPKFLRDPFWQGAIFTVALYFVVVYFGKT